MREAEDGVPDFVSTHDWLDLLCVFIFCDSLISTDSYHFVNIHDARAKRYYEQHHEYDFEILVHNSEISR